MIEWKYLIPIGGVTIAGLGWLGTLAWSRWQQRKMRARHEADLSQSAADLAILQQSEPAKEFEHEAIIRIDNAGSDDPGADIVQLWKEGQSRNRRTQGKAGPK